MSLLTKPKMTTRWKKTLLFAVSLLLPLPCVAAAAFNMRFEMEPAAQEPAQERNKEEREKQKVMEMRARSEITPGDALKEKIARDPQFALELQRRREVEMEMRELRQTALVRLAKVPMDQAIQIATSQQPGKVLSASLEATHWEEPGKLAKDGTVFYHVEIADEASAGTTHVLVNAVDGTVMKTEKELPRRRSPENQ